MITQVAEREFVHTIAPGNTPAEIAALVIAQPQAQLCIGLDQRVLDMNAGQVTAWIREFRMLHSELAPKWDVAPLAPPIAVFGASFTADEAKSLRAVGAVVFDRSLSSNAGCQSSVELLTSLSRSIPNISVSQSGPISATRRELNADELESLNSFPEGVKPSAVRDFLQLLNQSE